MDDGSRSEFSIEEHEQQHQSILSKMDLIIEMIRDLCDYIRTPTSPSENESEFPTVDLHLHGTIGDVQQDEEQQVEDSMMQIEANLHTPVEVNEAAESNPIVVEEISIQDVGGDDVWYQAEAISTSTIAGLQSPPINEDPNSAISIEIPVVEVIHNAKQLEMAECWELEENDGSVFGKFVVQNDACKVFAEMSESILEEDLLGIKGTTHHMFDEMPKLFLVDSDEEIYGEEDSLSSFSHNLNPKSDADKSNCDLGLLSDMSRLCKGVMIGFEKWPKEGNNLKPFTSSYLHGESMVYNYSIDEIGCRLFDPGGISLPQMDCVVLKFDNELVEIWVGEVLMIVFDPGCSFWLHNGCDSFEFFDDKQHFDKFSGNEAGSVLALKNVPPITMVGAVELLKVGSDFCTYPSFLSLLNGEEGPCEVVFTGSDLIKEGCFRKATRNRIQHFWNLGQAAIGIFIEFGMVVKDYHEAIVASTLQPCDSATPSLWNWYALFSLMFEQWARTFFGGSSFLIGDERNLLPFKVGKLLGAGIVLAIELLNIGTYFFTGPSSLVRDTPMITEFPLPALIGNKDLAAIVYSSLSLSPWLNGVVGSVCYELPVILPGLKLLGQTVTITFVGVGENSMGGYVLQMEQDIGKLEEVQQIFSKKDGIEWFASPEAIEASLFGDSSLYHKGYSSFKPNGEKQNCEFWVDELNVGSECSIAKAANVLATYFALNRTTKTIGWMGWNGEANAHRRGVHFAAAVAVMVSFCDSKSGQHISATHHIQQEYNIVVETSSNVGAETTYSFNMVTVRYLSTGTNDYIHFYQHNVPTVQFSRGTWSFNQSLAQTMMQKFKDLYIAENGAPYYSLWQYCGQNWECIDVINGIILEINVAIRYRADRQNKEPKGRVLLVQSEMEIDDCPFIVDVENVFWKPGRSVNFLYILENKDVFERVGKDILLVDRGGRRNLVTRVRDRD